MKKLMTLTLACIMMLGGSLAYSKVSRNAATAKAASAAPAATVSLSTAKKAK